MKWLPVALIALVACSQKTAKDAKSITKSQIDSAMDALNKKFADTLHPFAADAHKYGPPTGKIRVANMIEINGTPAGPVDLYDVSRPDSAAVPLIKNLAYGQISDYVSPRAGDSNATPTSNLWMFPAGTKQAAFPYGTNIDHHFYEPDDQITVAPGPTSMTGAIGYPDLIEGGKRKNSYRDSLRIIPTGQALLVVLQSNVNADSLPGLYLMIDGVCPLTTVFPKNTHPTGLGTDINFGVTPGTHTLGIITAKRGFGLLNCNGLKPGPTTSITVDAGHRYVVIVYGLAKDGFRILTAPIAGQ
jgi:hypothetical protein